VGALLEGDSECLIAGVASLETAKSGEISFLHHAKYNKFLAKTAASAVILKEEEAPMCSANRLIVKNPTYAYAKIAEEFIKPIKRPVGVHETAVVGDHCQIDASASIGPYVVIEEDVFIGANTCIEAGCFIGRGTTLGKGCHLYPRVTLYQDVQLGNGVTIHSGTVIGADGFGFARYEGGWYPIPQLKGVIIKDNVNIGANTAIDRGSTRDTVIEEGVILDNFIQIAHNVRVGAYTAIAGCVAIAGSTTIGKYCMIGGKAAIAGHLEIADQVVLTGRCAVSRSIRKPGMYSSDLGSMDNKDWRRNVAQFRRLDKTIQSLKASIKKEKNDG
jgi:UDP-3-O-[3-hydroxymyristoyl] glucosamine N-acyltransferase